MRPPECLELAASVVPPVPLDWCGAQTQATYDNLGRLLTATNLVRQNASAAYTTSYGYNDAGEQISLQMHYHRSEHWVVVKGTAEGERDANGRETDLFAGVE